MTDGLSKLIEVLKGYLAGKVTGRDAVHSIDGFVSSDQVYSLSDAESEAILELQDAASLYVPSQEGRKEFSGYFGDKRLAQIIREFLAAYQE